MTSSTTAATAATSSNPPTFDSLYTHLLTTHAAPLLPPSHRHSALLTSQISSLALHPTLEAALHILNADLPSAHFLVRHMPGPPAYAGMYLHGILHRVEGDYDNARAWYSDVAGSEVFEKVWGGKGGLEGAKVFVDKVEGLRKERRGDKGVLKRESRREIEGVVEWCVEKFGKGEVRDAREVWTKPTEKNRQMGNDMVVRGEGWRQF